MLFVLNILVTAVVVSFASWLSGRFPTLAGFIVALPLATLLVLPLSYREHADAAASILLARSIFVAIPVSLTFFLPFLFSDRLGLSFWQAYALGCAALPVGFFVHRMITRALLA
ncbi:MAG: hypothetical protein VX681_00995 [Myxococcota bacterium]|nr:hypothetical protein [Myxococcota bacterium]